MEIILVILVGLAAVLVVYLSVAQSGDPPKVGSPAPEFTLPDHSGQPRSSADFRGRRLVLFFYPQDETPECLAIVERLNRIAPAYADFAADFFAVAVCSPHEAAAYRAKHDVTFPVLCDADGRVAKRHGALINPGFGKFARKLIVVVAPDGTVERIFRDIVNTGPVDTLLAHLAEARERPGQGAGLV